MRLTRYFLPVLKENPAEAQIVSHRYMLRAGMIKQQAAGIYSWLPLGYRVLRRIEEIVHRGTGARGPHPAADAHAATGRSVARKRAL
jgi:prolyl-tRNA synthetase